MKKFKLSKLFFLLLFGTILALSGCSADDGSAGAAGAVGAAGPDGGAGPDGVSGPDGSTTSIDEACRVCHSEGSIGDVAVAHPVKLPKVEVSAIAVTQNADNTIDVAFNAMAAGSAVTDLTLADLGSYISTIIPAGTATSYVDSGGGSAGTWDTPYFERWVGESPSGYTDAQGSLNVADAANGNYVYSFVTKTTDILTQAPEGDLSAQTQRLILTVLGRVDVSSSTVGILDFMMPAAGAAATTGMAELERVIVDASACTACHNDPLENAAHGGSYQTPQACNMCHSPLGHYGKRMQDNLTYLPMLIHQLHSGIPNAAHPDRLNGQGYAGVKFPGDVKNCETCHADKGQDMADAWKTNPTMVICSTCHTAVDFNGVEFVGLDGVTKTHVSQADNFLCAECHTSTGLGTIADIVVVHAVENRTMNATITDVTVSDTTGNVAVTFTMDDGGTAVTDPAAFNSMAFTLAQLAPATGSTANHWVSYTARARTKDPAQPPVIQGYSENTGTLTDDGFGVFTYTFALVNANIDGDIRSNMNDVVNVSSGSSAGIYDATYPNVVTYDPSLTHRVGMEFKAANGVRNVTNATFDFVPDGLTALDTRQIVTMDSCNTCHGGTRLHKGYAVEYCVTCHNQSTFDPFSGDDPQTVDLQRMVHKLHMGSELPSVKDEGKSYVVNGGHDYSDLIIPQSVKNCTVCHNESNTDGTNWRKNPTSRACITCHDSVPQQAHSRANGGAN